MRRMSCKFLSSTLLLFVLIGVHVAHQQQQLSSDFASSYASMTFAIDDRLPPSGHHARRGELMLPYYHYSPNDSENDDLGEDAAQRIVNPCAADGICYCWRYSRTRKIAIDCSATGIDETSLLDISSFAGDVIELDLSKNSLRRAPADINIVRPLRSLNLAGNRIKNVDEELIASNLKALYLNDNEIESIDRRVFRKILRGSKITSFTLHGNPLVCNCETLDLFDFVHHAALMYPSLTNVTCASRGNDTKIIEMSRQEFCFAPIRANDDTLNISIEMSRPEFCSAPITADDDTLNISIKVAFILIFAFIINTAILYKLLRQFAAAKHTVNNVQFIL